MLVKVRADSVLEPSGAISHQSAHTFAIHDLPKDQSFKGSILDNIQYIVTDLHRVPPKNRMISHALQRYKQVCWSLTLKRIWKAEKCEFDSGKQLRIVHAFAIPGLRLVIGVDLKFSKPNARQGAEQC